MLGTIAGPLILSFDKKVHFYTYFKPLFKAIAIVAASFIIWDEYFTQKGIWGFNPDYLQGIYIGRLPIEEILFFILVPYACVFIYEVLKAYFPTIKLDKFAKYFAWGMAGTSFILAVSYINNWYTASACILAFMLTIALYFRKKEAWYPQFVFAYLVAVIPFTVVNGILTGMATPEPIVWYSESHIIGPRIITIPMEDLFYNYDLLILVVYFFEKFKRK